VPWQQCYSIRLLLRQVPFSHPTPPSPSSVPPFSFPLCFSVDLTAVSSKFGTNIYQLSSDKSLMFWGGEMIREITMLNEKTLPRVTQRDRGGQRTSTESKSSLRSSAREKSTIPPVDYNSVPSLELKIASGAPSRSRSTPPPSSLDLPSPSLPSIGADGVWCLCQATVL
jgi:hypothetical protein